MTTIRDLGPRICILGPSNSGKSTLAVAIAARHGHEAVHLDLLFHRPGTDWEPRPEHEFLALHEAAVAGERWVMDGNYSRCLPQRLRRATGVILLDVTTGTSLFRYLRRTWFESHVRLGALPGGSNRVNRAMLRHIAVVTPGNRRRYAAEFAGWEVPKLRLPSRRALARFYAAEQLGRSGRAGWR